MKKSHEKWDQNSIWWLVRFPNTWKFPPHDNSQLMKIPTTTNNTCTILLEIFGPFLARCDPAPLGSKSKSQERRTCFVPFYLAAGQKINPLAGSRCWCHNCSEPTYSSLDKLAQCRHITFTFYTLQIKSPTNWLNPRLKQPILNLFRLYSLRAIPHGVFQESTPEIFSSIRPRMF